ncbi:MAG: hypothetical protein ACEPOV_00820 [Hyphomicrobiales bacterium]
MKYSVLLYIAVLFFFLMGTASSCKKDDHYSHIPNISFNSLIKLKSKDQPASKAILSFSYIDGDGDIGLRQEDTLSPYHKTGDYYYNLIIDLEELQDNVWTKKYLINPSTLDTTYLHSRIPLLKDMDFKSYTKGEISDTLFIKDPFSEFDTIRFKFHIIDRTLNKSNIITTPNIIRD